MEESSKNKNFVQLSRTYMDDMGVLASENPVALRLFVFIAKHMDNNNALCVSMKALEEMLGYTRQTLSKAVKYLKSKGWLCVLKTGTSNIYIINPDIIWTSYANQKAYCKFQSTVIVTPTENAEYLNNARASFKYKHIDDNFINGVRTNREKHEKAIQNIQQSALDDENEPYYDETPYYGT